MNKNDEDFKKKEYTNYESPIQNQIELKDKQKQIDSNSLNQLLSVIYDDEFVIMINDLSHEIKLFNRSMIQFINQMKINLSNNYTSLESLNEQKNSELPNIHSLFNTIETSYKNFFSSAKNIFKKMKKYRNERLENINKLSFGEKNLKFCFINMNKNTGIKPEGRGVGMNQNKSVDLKDNISSY
jgi:predicted  nucleic acid-binding Zn-ribbon protein